MRLALQRQSCDWVTAPFGHEVYRHHFVTLVWYHGVGQVGRTEDDFHTLLLNTHADVVAVVLEQGVLFGFLEVMGNHLFHHVVQGDLGHPAQVGFGFGWVAQQGFYLGGAVVAGVNLHDALAHLQGRGCLAGNGGNYGLLGFAFSPELNRDAQLGGGSFNELAHAVLHAGGNHIVLRGVLLQHHPLHAHVVFGVAPVAQGAHVAHVQALLQALGNVGQAPGDFAGNKSLATARALVVKQDAVAGKHAIGLAVVHGNPVRIKLGYGVGAARVKGRGLALRGFLHQAIQL